MGAVAVSSGGAGARACEGLAWLGCRHLRVVELSHLTRAVSPTVSYPTRRELSHPEVSYPTPGESYPTRGELSHSRWDSSKAREISRVKGYLTRPLG